MAEVIQKRLLTKNEIGTELLKTTYTQQVNNFKTLFGFADGGQSYQTSATRSTLSTPTRLCHISFRLFEAGHSWYFGA